MTSKICPVLEVVIINKDRVLVMIDIRSKTKYAYGVSA